MGGGSTQHLSEMMPQRIFTAKPGFHGHHIHRFIRGFQHSLREKDPLVKQPVGDGCAIMGVTSEFGQNQARGFRCAVENGAVAAMVRGH